jgi:hypothetical protein
MNTLMINDLALIEELSDDAARSIAGGRINLRQYSPDPTPSPESSGGGGMLHPGDDSTNIWWSHGYW